MATNYTPVVATDNLLLGLNARLQELDDAIEDVRASVGETPSCVQGRLTPTSGTPVVTSNVLAVSTVYFTPYRGDRISLYDGSDWVTISFTQKSLALTGKSAAVPHDVFGYIDGGGALALEALAWSSTTARATGLSYANGVLVKSGDTTRRYLGTLRLTATGTTEMRFDFSGSSSAHCGIWNYYNRVERLFRYQTGSSHTYASITARQWNADAAAQVKLVFGWSDAAIHVFASASVQSSSASGQTRLWAGTSSLAARMPGLSYFSHTGTVETTIGSAVRFDVDSVGTDDVVLVEQTNGTGTSTYNRGALFVTVAC